MSCVVEDEWLLTNAAEYCYTVPFFHFAYWCGQHDRGFTAIASSKKYVCGQARQRRFDVESQLRRTINDLLARCL